MNATTRAGLYATPLFLLLVAACGTPRPVERSHSETRPTLAPARPRPGLYAADEALRDALSGPWQYVGTGPWPGGGRMQACAFRNARVFVVDVYCGIQDTQAFRVEIYSPSRGRVRIYAESKAPVSAHLRPEYFSFAAESEPPPGPAVRMPKLDLSMSFSALSDYEEARHAAYLPACFGGMERHLPRSGCLGPLASEASAWQQQNGRFLARASDDWYRIVRELRTLAARYGKAPK